MVDQKYYLKFIKLVVKLEANFIYVLYIADAIEQLNGKL